MSRECLKYHTGELIKKTWNNCKDVFKRLGLIPYQPFKFNGTYCFIDVRPMIEIYDVYDYGWIAVNSKDTCWNLNYLLEHKEEIQPFTEETLDTDLYQWSVIDRWQEWKERLFKWELESAVYKAIELLKVDGCNSKKQALELLESVVKCGKTY